LVRHWRSSDGTISINLHRMNVVPRHDERFSSQLPVTEKFIACHGVLPTTPETTIEQLNSEQRILDEASEAKPNKIEGFSQDWVNTII
jgi:hypothetical protein